MAFLDFFEPVFKQVKKASDILSEEAAKNIIELSGNIRNRNARSWDELVPTERFAPSRGGSNVDVLDWKTPWPYLLFIASPLLIIILVSVLARGKTKRRR